jgi:hypothetical protein
MTFGVAKNRVTETIKPTQKVACLAEGTVAGGGRLERFGGPVKQAFANAFFKALNTAGDSRLSQPKAICRTVKGLRVCNSDKGLKLASIHRTDLII